jgi:hypothetical protein
MQIYSKLNWFKKLNTPRVTAGQFVYVESKQLCRDINTLLEIKEKNYSQHETPRDVT